MNFYENIRSEGEGGGEGGVYENAGRRAKKICTVREKDVGTLKLYTTILYFYEIVYIFCEQCVYYEVFRGFER